VSAAYDGLSRTVAGFAPATAAVNAAYDGLSKTVAGFAPATAAVSAAVAGGKKKVALRKKANDYRKKKTFY
jgi:uncharacterized membrane protein YesL